MKSPNSLILLMSRPLSVYSWSKDGISWGCNMLGLAWIWWPKDGISDGYNKPVNGSSTSLSRSIKSSYLALAWFGSYPPKAGKCSESFMFNFYCSLLSLSFCSAMSLSTSWISSGYPGSYISSGSSILYTRMLLPILFSTSLAYSFICCCFCSSI